MTRPQAVPAIRKMIQVPADLHQRWVEAPIRDAQSTSLLSFSAYMVYLLRKELDLENKS